MCDCATPKCEEHSKHGDLSIGRHSRVGPLRSSHAPPSGRCFEHAHRGFGDPVDVNPLYALVLFQGKISFVGRRGGAGRFPPPLACGDLSLPRGPSSHGCFSSKDYDFPRRAPEWSGETSSHATPAPPERKKRGVYPSLSTLKLCRACSTAIFCAVTDLCTAKQELSPSSIDHRSSINPADEKHPPTPPPQARQNVRWWP